MEMRVGRDTKVYELATAIQRALSNGEAETVELKAMGPEPTYVAVRAAIQAKGQLAMENKAVKFDLGLYSRKDSRSQDSITGIQITVSLQA